MDVYVYDKNLLLVTVIDTYKSLIWANRYKEIGDCELYLEANPVNLDSLKIGYYLARNDDSMICQIRKIEIQTDAENGNYMIVTGVDTKVLLDQRIIWNMMTCNGNVEDFIRQMITSSCISPTNPDRELRKLNTQKLVQLGTKANFTEVSSEQVSYKNVGEKIREYCETFKWGYRFVLRNSKLTFELYKGTDRSNSVIFSDEYENLSSSVYIHDRTNMGNVALIAGSGEGSSRIKTYYGTQNSVNRFEVYVDAKDISRDISYSELTEFYPLIADGGQGYLDGTNYKYQSLDIEVVTEQQLIELEYYYPDGEYIQIDGHDYYRVSNIVVAVLESSTPDSSTNATLSVPVYEVYLLNRGEEKVAEYGETKTFEGSVIPDVTFVYKRDFFLGDVVRVENEFGISANARITEVIEVFDDNGYSIEPKFESEV